MKRIWQREIKKNLLSKPEVKRPLGRCRYRWEDIIKINLWEGVDWLHLNHPVDRILLH